MKQTYTKEEVVAIMQSIESYYKLRWYNSPAMQRNDESQEQILKCIWRIKQMFWVTPEDYF